MPRRLTDPLLRPSPTLIVGISLLTTVAIVVLSVVWPILLNTAAAARAVPKTRLEAARVLQLSRFDRIAKVLVPSTLPGVLLGVRVAVSIALIVTLLAEILGAGDGVGRVLYQRQQVFDAASVWGLLLIVGVLGFLINALVSWGQGRLLRGWDGHRRS
jgi:sulfonate transport system permease protein